MRTPGPLLRRVLGLAEKFGRTVTVLAMLLLTTAALLLTVNTPGDGPAGAVPAASYGD